METYHFLNTIICTLLNCICGESFPQDKIQVKRNQMGQTVQQFVLHILTLKFITCFLFFKLFHLVFLLQQFPLALVLAKRDQDSKNTLQRQDKFNECKCKPCTTCRKFKSCQKAIMVIAGRAHCFFYSVIFQNSTSFNRITEN